MVGGRQSLVMAGYFHRLLVICPFLGVCHNFLVFHRVLFNFIEKSMQILYLNQYIKKIGPHLECFSSIHVESLFYFFTERKYKNLNDRIDRN